MPTYDVLLDYAVKIFPYFFTRTGRVNVSDFVCEIAWRFGFEPVELLEQENTLSDLITVAAAANGFVVKERI